MTNQATTPSAAELKAREVAAAMLINAGHDEVYDRLDAADDDPFAAKVYSALRELGFRLEESSRG